MGRPPNVKSFTTFQSMRGELKHAFVARDKEIDGLLLALLTNQNILMLGPPGTAKTMLSSVVASGIGGKFFNQLLTGFSTPEELFGPYDMKALQQSKWERAVAGYMPDSDITVADEIFKGNSAILNGVLTLINEGVYKQGPHTVKSPLRLTVGCSNEYPSESSLEALYDRFLLRFWVPYLTKRADKMKLLTCPDPASMVNATVSLADLNQLCAECTSVVVTEDLLETLLDCLDLIEQKHSIKVSDRTLRSLPKLIRGHAYLSGNMVATKRDLIVLADSIWHRHDQRSDIMHALMSIVAPDLSRMVQLRDAAVEEFTKIGDFGKPDEITPVLSRIKSIEAESLKIDCASDQLMEETREEITLLRKEIARLFMASAGMI